MPSTDIDPTPALRAQLIARLSRQGALTSPAWAAAFASVPRDFFVSRFDVPTSDGLVAFDLADADRRVTALVRAYADTTLITQFDAGGTATSSSTEPSLMATMLELLGVQDGHRVLEVGAGTGYNAALLCHRLGDARVVSIDIDPDLVDAAGAALARAGYHPTLIAGDGALGAPEHAPFDRIIATCGLDRIPPAWLGQVRAGGVIVANVGFGLVHLTVAEDGSAAGPFVGPAAFMHIRPDATSIAFTHRDALALTSGTGVARTAPLPTDLDAQPVGFLRRVIMSAVEPVTIHSDSGDIYCLADPVTGSWVRATPRGNGSVELVECGPRQLWDELREVVDAWHSAGRPGIERYGLTVTADGTNNLWLDTSDQPVAGF